MSSSVISFANQQGQIMHTLEERIQRLETSCRRWRLMTLAVAGFTVAHFATRQPLEAQSQTTPKELRADHIVCNSIEIVDKMNGNKSKGAQIKASENSVELTLRNQSMLFGIHLFKLKEDDDARVYLSDDRGSFSLLPDRLRFDHKRNHFSLTSKELSFTREDEAGTRNRERQDEIITRMLRLKAQSKELDSDTQQEFRELINDYDNHVRKSVSIETDTQGGGRLNVMNVFGDPVVSAYADQRNGGQFVVGNADKEVIHAIPILK